MESEGEHDPRRSLDLKEEKEPSAEGATPLPRQLRVARVVRRALRARTDVKRETARPEDDQGRDQPTASATRCAERRDQTDGRRPDRVDPTARSGPHPHAPGDDHRRDQEQGDADHRESRQETTSRVRRSLRDTQDTLRRFRRPSIYFDGRADFTFPTRRREESHAVA